MLFRSFLASGLLVLSTLMSSAKADDLPEIEVVGNKFFYKNNGSQFYVKGIAYQQDVTNATDSSFSDPLSDADACKRDIPYLQAVDTNVIRVYALNVSLDHSDCMSMLQDAGIYVIADLSEPDLSINRNDPQWTVELYNRYAGVVDLFQNYTNVLGFFAGNEVSNNKTNTDASAFVKAAIRDMKAYMKAQDYRAIPVGYSANDDQDIRDSLADYFACGDEDERADFFGINMYEWCGSSSFKASGYETATEQYKNLGIPIFFSEYGCNTKGTRTFQEVGTLFSSEMTDVWSGGIVYMYFQEDNDYGLVSVDGNSVSTMKDYSNYKSEILKISPSSATASDASTTVTSCPTSTSNWEASTDLPPTPNKELCDCMSEAATCVVSSDVDSDDYSDLFSYVCEKVDCSGITGNGTSGVYGAYSPCSDKARLNFVLNLYYEKHGSSLSACDFDGSASSKKASTALSCSALLKSAGTSGMGSVSASVQTTKHTNITNSKSTATSGSSGSSSSGSSSSGSGKSSGAAPQYSFDLVTRCLLVGACMIVGAGMVMA
ncbi:uncharacterized protein PRCAT00003220001 [Priceomyces carsonii]|uniref:uncharacterized protein n=1 Tax=Priceomyces carsonii TaxID=28549 RepID=UPI002ED7F454|nr:unnamed protein product [Priceomyces carsonii]